MSFGVFIVAILISFCKKTLFSFGVIAKECRSLFLCYLTMEILQLRDAAIATSR